MYIEIIDNDKSYSFLYTVYKEDPELIEKFHTMNGTDIDTCVDYVLTNLEKDHSIIYVIFSEINNDIIGFFASSFINIENENIPLLASFFIRPKYRKLITDMVWNEINDHFKNEMFVVSIVKNNIPANKFFNKKCTSTIEWFCEDLKKQATLFVFNGV